MDSTQNEKLTAKGRDPVKSKGGRGTENNPHKKPNSPTPNTTPRAPGTGASQHSQEPAQGPEVGRAKERKKHPADNPLNLTVAVSTLVASRGVNKKSQDSGPDGTGQKSTAPLQQAVVGIDSTPTEDEGLHLHEREGNIPDLPGKVPTSRDSKLIVSEKGQSQPRQEDRTALNGAKLPPAHTPDPPPTPTIKGRRGQLPGPDTAQEPDGLILDSNSAITGFTEFTNTATSESSTRREEQLLEKYASHATDAPMPRSDGAKTTLPRALYSGTAETKIIEPEPTLTQAEKTSIDKRRRRQVRAKGEDKRSAACFTLGTPILVRKPDKASWIPIWTAKRGDVVVQSLPSGKIEDLSGALMTKIETVCTFECSAGGIDIVQMGEARITAHHHIQTEDGWMTARQAADMGHGALLTNLVLPRVYSLCLEGGGNIIINTTATPQNAPTQIAAATMGCCFESSIDPQHKGSLTYPDNIRARMGQIRGMEFGRKHFKANEVETQPNRELHFKTIPIKRVDPPIPDEERLETILWPSMHDTTILQKANPRDRWVAQGHLKGMAGRPTPQTPFFAPKTTAQPESDTVTEMVKREHRGKLTKPIGLSDTSHSDPTTGQRPPETHPGDLDTAKGGLPELEPTEHTSTINKDTAKKFPKPHQDSTHEHQTDIYVQTPTGGYVPWQDVKWEPNPYAEACRDTSDLMGIAPGHYHLRASSTATTLCALVQTDLRSQF